MKIFIRVKDKFFRLFWNTCGQGKISEGIMSFWIGFGFGALALGYALKMVLEAMK